MEEAKELSTDKDLQSRVKAKRLPRSEAVAKAGAEEREIGER